MNTRGKKAQIFGFPLIFAIFIMQMFCITNSLSGNTIFSIKTAMAQPDFQSIVTQIPREQADTNMDEWTNPQYQMLLISPPEWHNESQILADWKNKVGIRTLVVSNWVSFIGADGAERVRNAIKWYYDRYPIEFVLIMGGTSKIPIRYIYNYDVDEVPKSSESYGVDQTVKPTDYYYAELTSNWDIDGDGRWGEPASKNSINKQHEWEYDTEVYVGRFPADTSQELLAMIQKTIDYEQGKGAGDWMNRYLAASGISDRPYTSPEPGDLDGEYEMYLNQYIIDNVIGDKMNWAHFYETSNGYSIPTYVNRTFALGQSSIATAMNWGFSVGIWAGHGAPSNFQALSVGSPLSASDIGTLTNQYMYPVLYADACSTARIDIDGSVGEAFIKAENAGGIGFIGNTRISWYWPNDTNFDTLNRGLARAFMEEMFLNGKSQQGKALYDSKKTYRNYQWFANLPSNWNYTEVERKVIMLYILLGDPSVHIYTNVAKNFNPIFNQGTQYYEGVKITKHIQSSDGTPIANARVTLWGGNQYYHTFITNLNGDVEISLPVGVNSLNYSISAHNMIFMNGTFNLKPDLTKPSFAGLLKMTPTTPTIGDQVDFEISVSDEESGVSDVHVILTSNEFQSNKIYPMELIQNSGINSNFSVLLPQLEYNSYRFVIVAFDFAGNYEILNQNLEDQSFTVPVPIQAYLLIVVNIVLVAAIITTFTRLSKKILVTLEEQQINSKTDNPNNQIEFLTTSDKKSSEEGI